MRPILGECREDRGSCCVQSSSDFFQSLALQAEKRKPGSIYAGEDLGLESNLDRKREIVAGESLGRSAQTRWAERLNSRERSV